MKVNGESIYGAGPSSLRYQPLWGRMTQKGKTIYLHIFDWPKDGKLIVPDLGWQQGPITSCFLMDPSRTSLKMSTNPKTKSVVIDLPAQAEDPIDTVVKVSP